jgi:hypothetical protein
MVSLRCINLELPMTEMGHFRQIDPLPTLSACPLRPDRFRTFAPQRFDAVCEPTYAVQQIAAYSITSSAEHLFGLCKHAPNSRE